MTLPRNPRRARAFALAAACLFVCVAPTAFAAAAHNAPPRVDLRALETAKSFDRFIVKFRAGTAPAAGGSALQGALDRAAIRTKDAIASAQAARGGAPLVQGWNLQHRRRLGVDADVFVSSQKLGRAQVRLLLQQLGADPDVEYVEIDQVLHAALVPNDTSYSSLWGMQDADAGIRANTAWDLNNGSGVVVAVIDTGYTEHSDLAGNIVAGYDMISDVARANDGSSRDSDAHDPGDWDDGGGSSWHGTHVAGTIAAVGNNAKGVIGVAYGAKILPVRVLGVGGGDGSDIADGITWASGGSVPGAPANPNPAEVLNLSIGGGGGCSATYQSAIDGAVSRGSTVVVAAGNDALDAGNGSLATCNNVIVVGAHTSSAARSSFSNYGSVVDVTAPGSSILSTINTGSTTPSTEGYANYQGTSMATPHVAGTAALAQAYRVAKGLAPYTPAQLEAQLKATAYPLSLGCSASSGAGIIDARALLDTADGSFKLLSNGVAQTNQSAATGVGLRFAMPTSSQATGLAFATSGGTGNADLYVKFGSAPTTSVYDCRSNAAGNSESCSFPTTSPGTYYVLVQAASGYSGVSVTGSLAGNLKPSPAFSLSTSGLSATFTDASTDADGGVTSRTWTFGDGGTSTLTNPVHAYSIAGAYTVQLKATDGGGANNCVLKQVNVNPPPVALSNGVAVNNIAANIGAQLPYTLAVPAGASNLSFATTAGNGDADLYVKFGSPPTLQSFDCVSGTATAIENCSIANPPSAGTWYVLVHAYSNISGVSLVGSYTGGSGNVAPTANFSFTTTALTANFTDSSTDSDGSIASRSWNFGDGSSSTSTNPSHTYANPGTYTVQLTVTDNGGLTNSISKQVTVSSGGGVTVSIADVAITEGNGTSKTMTFKVLLSAAASGPVKYNIATSDGTAVAGSDYTAKSLTGATITAGVLSKNFSVSIKGDTASEPDETFNVTLSNVTGATVADGQAVGTIQNDDGATGSATLSIGDVTAAEGNSGTKQFVFTVSLSQAAATDVSYNIATSGGTATAGSDYVASSLNGQVIPAGQTSKTFSVTVNGDTVVETNERIRVSVSGVSGASLLDGLGIGTITNDD